MFACRLLIGFALAASTSGYFRAAEPVPASKPKPAPAGEPAVALKPPAADPSTAHTPREGIAGARNPNAELEPVARELFAKGRYKESLDAYTRWEPRSWCGTCLEGMHGERYSRIALCHAHLKAHAAAATSCLKAAGRMGWLGDADKFLVQLYREAEQLDDLGPLLDVIEKSIIHKHQKSPILTPEEDRESLEGRMHTRAARRILEQAKLGKLAPWPDGVPKPKPGSLPKTLAK